MCCRISAVVQQRRDVLSVDCSSKLSKSEVGAGSNKKKYWMVTEKNALEKRHWTYVTVRAFIQYVPICTVF
jgi:hypothetical protein